MPADQRLHPGFGGLGVVDLLPAVADPDVVGLEVLVHQGVVVFDPAFEQDLVGDRGKFPPGSNIARGPAAGDFLDEFDRPVQDGRLLLAGHGDGVFMRVPVHADFVPGVDDHPGQVREGLDRVARHEPGGGQAVLLEKPDEPRAADLAAEQAAGDIAGRVLAPVGAEHSGNCVHVDAERDLDVLSHEINLSLRFCWVWLLLRFAWLWFGWRAGTSQGACPAGRRSPRSRPRECRA